MCDGNVKNDRESGREYPFGGERSLDELDRLALDNEMLTLRIERLELLLAEYRNRLCSVEIDLRQCRDVNETLHTRCVDLEQTSERLTRLWLSTASLHGTAGRDDLLETVHEILSICVGTKSYAVYEARPEGLVLLAGHGEHAAPSLITPGFGPIGTDAANGRVVVRRVRGDSDEAVPLVSIPLRIGSESVGLIAIFEFDENAPEPHVDTLFELLSAQAGIALRRCARMSGEIVASPPPGVCHES